MPILESTLDTSSPAFAANREAWLKLIDDFRVLEQRVRDASAKAKPVFDRRGQLLPRERVARLLDAGAPWLELSTRRRLVVDNPDPAKTMPGGGVIAGIGYVSGTRCMVAASTPASTPAPSSDGPGEDAARAGHRAARTSCPSCT
jgi:geranyl-CoA carboxylase beta subunit